MWKVEVVADNSGKWSSNSLRFATREKAETYAKDLFSRWMSVREWRVVQEELTAVEEWGDATLTEDQAAEMLRKEQEETE